MGETPPPSGEVRRTRAWVALVACMAIALFVSWLLADNRNDDAYITYRHTQNLLLGRGFVFNPGQRVLVTTAPFHGLFLALPGALGLEPVKAAPWLSGVAAGAVAYFVFRLLDDAGYLVAGVVAAATVLSCG